MRVYSRYKASDLQGVGDIPEHWLRTKLGRTVSELQTGPFGSQLHAEDYVENGIPLVNPAHMSAGCIIPDPENSVDEETAERLSVHRIQEGDILFGRRGEIGRCALAGVESSGWLCGTGSIRVRPDRLLVRPDFLFHTLGSKYVRERLRLEAVGSTMENLNTSILANLPLCLPPLDEQRAIAAFLDRETAKIDALVEEQRRLIALLKEKRQAVISHAVTKGLDPTAPMKPSGIDWLGDVPAHWEMKRLKHAIESLEQGWSPQCHSFAADAGEWGVLKVGCVNGGQFRPEENKALPDDLAPRPDLSLIPGDILMSRANTRELVGSAAVVPNDFPSLMICDKIYRMRCRKDAARPQFVSLVLNTSLARQRIELDATGASSSMLNIGQDTVRELPFLTPPIAEQDAIVHFLDVGVSKLEELASQAERAIKLLQERRSALISAAVTGKIDVRDAVAEHTEAA